MLAKHHSMAAGMGAKRKLKKEKKVLVFDENSRREYLLGFQKRKNERRKKAHEEFVKKEKEKRRELKQQACRKNPKIEINKFMHRVIKRKVSATDIYQKKRSMLDQIEKQRRELEALESDIDDEEEDQQDVTSVNTTYDHPEHVVTVTAINDINMENGRFACIGPNRGVIETSGLKEDDPPVSEKKDVKVKKAEKVTSKGQRFHKKFRNKRNNKKGMREQDGRPGKDRKRKHIHSGFHGKSKKSKS